MKNKIISIVLSTAMLCPASFAVSNTNNKNESKNENKIISYIKRNPIKTTIYSLGSLAFVTLSSYLVHKYINSKKINQEGLEIKENTENRLLENPYLPRREVPAIKADSEDKLLRGKNVFGFFAYDTLGRSTRISTVEMFDSSVYFDKSLGYDNENNKNSLIEICKRVCDAVYEGEISKRPLPPFVLIDGNFETLGNNRYWCEFERDFEGNKSNENKIIENAEKICDFDYSIGNKTAKLSLYKEKIYEDPLDKIEVNNKIPVLSKTKCNNTDTSPKSSILKIDDDLKQRLCLDIEEKKESEKSEFNALKRGFIPETNEDNLKHGLCLELLNNY